MQKFIRIKSKDLHTLKSLPFNRDLYNTQSLQDKMSNNGWQGTVQLIETNLITGKKEIYIADGHHRVDAASKIGIDVDAVLTDKKFIHITDIVEYVASLNNTQKAWKPEDYVNAYCYLREFEYLKLQQLTSKSFYSISTIATISYGVRERGIVKDKLITGNYICNFEEHTEYVINLSQKLLMTKRPNQRQILAISYLSNTKIWDEKKFINKWRQEGSKICNMELPDTLDLFTKWLK